jgi:hypothetical protein
MSYLSVDLDFFNGRRDFDVLSFAKHLAGKKLFLAKYHHELLPHINERDYGRLINVDFHSDVCGETPYPLNEGNWVNYVTWKRGGWYTWRYPCRKLTLDNYCHEKIDPFTEGGSGWGKITKNCGCDLFWPGVERVGICLSPDWVQRRKILYDFMDMIKMPKEWLE